MLITLHSEDPRFSWQIVKNPATQAATAAPFERELRKGRLLGWYTDPQTFRLWFRDSPTEASFALNGEFEYLDQSRYASPYLLHSMIGEMLASAAKTPNLPVPPAKHTLTVEALRLPMPRLVSVFNDHLSGQVEIEATLLAGKSYRVEFRTDGALYQLLAAVQLFSILQAALDKSFWLDCSDPVVLKTARLLSQAQAPYYLRYLVVRHLLVSEQQLARVRAELEGPDMRLHYGDTRVQRYAAIKRHLEGGPLLLDIGCGELYQASRLAKLYDAVDAYDADSELQQANARFLEKRGIHNVTLRGAADAALSFPPEADVLMTEVLEHLPREEAQRLLARVRENGFRKVVLTVPNADFNKHYLLADEFRHNDHHWEPTRADLEALLHAEFGTGFEVQITGAGDRVGPDSTSFLATITPR